MQYNKETGKQLNEKSYTQSMLALSYVDYICTLTVTDVAKGMNTKLNLSI